MKSANLTTTGCTSPFETDSIVFQILSHIDNFPDLVNAMSVNSLWRKAGSTPKAWISVFCSVLLARDDLTSISTSTAKALVMSKLAANHLTLKVANCRKDFDVRVYIKLAEDVGKDVHMWSTDLEFVIKECKADQERWDDFQDACRTFLVGTEFGIP